MQTQPLIPPGQDRSWFLAFIDHLVGDEDLETARIRERKVRHDRRFDDDARRAVEGGRS